MQSISQNKTSLTSQTETHSFAFLVGQTNVWVQAPRSSAAQKSSLVQTQMTTSNLREEFSKRMTLKEAAAAADDHNNSHDSLSTDEEVGSPKDIYSTMHTLLQLKDGKNFEIDSRTGITGQQTCWTFQCVHDELSNKFFIWLGNVTIDKFTKTTFLNLVNFATNLDAKQMVLIMNREHNKKEQFQKLFKVLDAHRLSKRSMQELMGAEKIEENAENYAVYRIELQ